MPPGLHLLLSLDPQSAEFLELFGSYLSSKDERTNVLALSEPDTKLFIEIVDRVCPPRVSFGPMILIFGYEGAPSRAIRYQTSPTCFLCSEEVVWQDGTPS